ncbi:MAG: FkbM family methyltransferase [Bacteroidales bacterium]|nr:FkbM family methyltransferase [Bacteroidales bacterium]
MKKILRFIRNLVPFKIYIFKLIRPLKLPRNIIQHLWFKGKFKVEVENKKYFRMHHNGCYIENELFWYGMNGYEKESLKIWKELSKKSKVIFDIGAHSGIYSLVAFCVNPSASVYAFEPLERIYNNLIRNIKLNNYNIKALNIAISDTSGKKVIYDRKTPQETGATLTPPSDFTEILSYEVNTLSIDDFIKKNNIKKIDLLKIDVETHEPFVLKGYNNIINHNPYILIEILYDYIGQEIEEILNSYGVKYEYFFINEEKGLQKTSTIKRMSDKYFNYLLIPYNSNLVF